MESGGAHGRGEDLEGLEPRRGGRSTTQPPGTDGLGRGTLDIGPPGVCPVSPVGEARADVFEPSQGRKFGKIFYNWHIESLEVARGSFFLSPRPITRGSHPGPKVPVKTLYASSAPSVRTLGRPLKDVQRDSHGKSPSYTETEWLPSYVGLAGMHPGRLPAISAPAASGFPEGRSLRTKKAPLSGGLAGRERGLQLSTLTTTTHEPVTDLALKFQN